MLSNNCPCGYYLRLANGQSWHLVASAEAAKWLDRFAHVMQLRRIEENSSTQILFSCGFPPDEARDNWTLEYSCIDFSIYRSNLYTSFICDIEKIGGDSADYAKMLLSLHTVFSDIIRTGGFPFHAALLERNGHGVLIAAEGGTGKSTCCRRVPPPWKALCDDETILCLCGDHYEAHPFPTWSDYVLDREKKTWDVQKHVKIDAIFFLRQAPQDRIIPLRSVKTALLIYESAAQACNRIYANKSEKTSRDVFNKVFDNTYEASKRVPSYELYASLDGKFWELIDTVLPG